MVIDSLESLYKHQLDFRVIVSGSGIVTLPISGDPTLLVRLGQGRPTVFLNFCKERVLAIQNVLVHEESSLVLLSMEAEADL